MRSVNYDLMVHRENGDSFGYMCEWGSEGQSPAVIESLPPDVSVSTSSNVTQAGGQFSARDAAPPYPIELNNWQDGAGQATYDSVDASPEAFRASRSVDVADEGQFSLGPRCLNFPYATVSNRVLAALGTFWAGFTPAAEDPRDTLRFLRRYTMVSEATDYLGTTAATTLKVTDASNLPDLALSVTIAAPRVGDYLYCPTHNEVVKITVVDGVTLTVERAQSGTTAVVHSAGETWYAFDWFPVTYTGDDPTQALSAMATDGKYIYSAYHNSGTDNGSVWKGTTSGDHTSFDVRNNIVALCYCGGYLYGAQDNLSGVTSAGWFNTASGNAFTAISLAGAIPIGASTVALVGIGNFAYWVLSDGISHSWAYRIQHSSSDTFELVAELPPGFIATSAISHLGNLYIAGYIDNLATVSGDANLPRYEGALYLIETEGGVEQVVRIRLPREMPSADTRIKGLSAAGPYVFMLTNEDTYVYDVQHGGWSHYADTDTSETVGEDGGIDWKANGFQWWASWYAGVPFHLETERAAWDTDSDGYVDSDLIITEESSSAGYSWSDDAVLTVNAGKWHGWNLDGLPASQATVMFTADMLQSQAGCVIMAGASKEVRLFLRGAYSGGTVVSHLAGLGYMTDPDGAVADYDIRWAGGLDVGLHVYRVTLSSSGAKLYIDNVLAVTVDYDELRNVTGDEATLFRWAVGWPGLAQPDNVKEKIRYTSIKFTADGAYPPDYTGGTIVTTMRDIGTLQGVSLVPVPGDSIDYINTMEVTGEGWLETSDSAFHMGSVNKYFTSVMVEHTRLLEGQTLTVTPIVDDTAYASQAAETGTTLTTARIGVGGRKVRVRVQLTDDTPNRLYADRLRVTRITTRFFPYNSPHVHTYYLNCREGAQARNGRVWGYDPEAAIRHLFAAADTGEVVYIESLFTGNLEDQMQRARIEEVHLYPGPGSLHRYDHLEGTVQLKMRRVDE